MAKRRQNGCWVLSVPPLSPAEGIDESSVPKGNTRDLCLGWPPATHPLHTSPHQACPLLPSTSLHPAPAPPSKIIPSLFQESSAAPTPFAPFPEAHLLFHQQSLGLSLTTAFFLLPLWGLGSLLSLQKAEALSNLPCAPHGPSTVLGSEPVTREC